ncbi:MAG: pyruvate kinase, partial [Oscillospiraceae bacterium]|nr:pyruvate kinase [Oscillospiraceae bacterium]
PTRAEITDVANAIYDGTSAIMLSGETAAGKYPVEAVRTMQLIASTTESDIDYRHEFESREEDGNASVALGIAHAAVTTAHDLGAKAIIAVTKRGQTARLISKFRPAVPILGCTTDEVNQRRMNLSWGVTPYVIDEVNDTDSLFAKAVEAAKAQGLVETDDLVVITAGVPLGISGMTNLMKVEIVK